MKIPEDLLHAEIGIDGRRRAMQFEEDYTSDALAWSLVAAMEQLATLKLQLESCQKPVTDERVLEMAKQCIIPDVYPQELEQFLVMYHEYLATRSPSTQKEMK